MIEFLRGHITRGTLSLQCLNLKKPLKLLILYNSTCAVKSVRSNRCGTVPQRGIITLFLDMATEDKNLGSAQMAVQVLTIAPHCMQGCPADSVHLCGMCCRLVTLAYCFNFFPFPTGNLNYEYCIFPPYCTFFSFFFFEGECSNVSLR